MGQNRIWDLLVTTTLRLHTTGTTAATTTPPRCDSPLQTRWLDCDHHPVLWKKFVVVFLLSFPRVFFFLCCLSFPFEGVRQKAHKKRYHCICSFFFVTFFIYFIPCRGLEKFFPIPSLLQKVFVIFIHITYGSFSFFLPFFFLFFFLFSTSKSFSPI